MKKLEVREHCSHCYDRGVQDEQELSNFKIKVILGAALVIGLFTVLMIAVVFLEQDVVLEKTLDNICKDVYGDYEYVGHDDSTKSIKCVKAQQVKTIGGDCDCETSLDVLD